MIFGNTTQQGQCSGLPAGPLRPLVSSGQLWGVRLGRNWVTTAKAVEEDMGQDRRAGRPPFRAGNTAIPTLARLPLDTTSTFVL